MLMKCSQTQVTSRPLYIIYVTTYYITLKIKKKNSVFFIKLSWYLLLTSLHHFQVKFNYSYHLSSGEFSYQHQKQFPRTSHYVHTSQFRPFTDVCVCQCLIEILPKPIYIFIIQRKQMKHFNSTYMQHRNLEKPKKKILIRQS